MSQVKTEFDTWLVVLYRDGKYDSRFELPMSEVVAQHAVDDFNQISADRVAMCVPCRITADIPQRLEDAAAVG